MQILEGDFLCLYSTAHYGYYLQNNRMNITTLHAETDKEFDVKMQSAGSGYFWWGNNQLNPDAIRAFIHERERIAWEARSKEVAEEICQIIVETDWQLYSSPGVNKLSDLARKLVHKIRSTPSHD